MNESTNKRNLCKYVNVKLITKKAAINRSLQFIHSKHP